MTMLVTESYEINIGSDIEWCEFVIIAIQLVERDAIVTRYHILK